MDAGDLALLLARLDAAQAEYDAGRFAGALSLLATVEWPADDPWAATTVSAPLPLAADAPADPGASATMTPAAPPAPANLSPAVALWRLRALASFRIGEMADALRAAQAALAAARPRAEAQQAARIDVLAIAVVAAGELALYEPALEHLREMLSLAARSDRFADYVRARGTAANGFALMGDPWAAQRLLGELIGQFHGLHDQERLEAAVRGNHSSVCLQVARLARAAGDAAAVDEALEHAALSVERARELAQSIGDPRVAAFADVHEAELALLRGRGADALPLLAGAVRAVEARGLEAHARQLRLLEAEALLSVGDGEGAHDRLAPLEGRVTDGHELSVRIRLPLLMHETLARQRDAAAQATALPHLLRARELEQLRLYRQLHAQSRFLRTRLELEHLYRWTAGAPR